MGGNPVLGVLLHAIGGLAAASFYIPLKKVRNWSWETFWLIQGIVSWLIVPFFVAALVIPNLPSVLSEGLHMPGRWGIPVAGWAYIYGALWGIGGLTFGLSMRYLGMSLGYAIALGFCAMGGTILPPLFAGKASDLVTLTSGRFVLLGAMVCLAGITVCAYAGTLKEKELTAEQKRAAIAEFALTKGVMVAIFAGIMSACMSLAADSVKPMGDLAVDIGANPVFHRIPGFVFILAGGFTTNFIWCLILGIVNKTVGDFKKEPCLANLGWCALGGTCWYFQFFFYSMGTTQMGKFDFASWTIHMAFIIAFSNLWGLAFKEWAGSGVRTLRTVYTGIAVLLLSTVVTGANYYFARSEVPQRHTTKKAAAQPKPLKPAVSNPSRGK